VAFDGNAQSFRVVHTLAFLRRKDEEREPLSGSRVRSVYLAAGLSRHRARRT